ncbi:MAG: LacI family DNA-binding transcriptional regulator [Spirochaetales bacterium]|nr:LacI family DNA-binding transcriptional regulator [Spirochaetales bacterium]
MTIYELAEKAGVSTATISRVLNNSPKVSEKTRNRIHKLMKEENYVPSAFARGLSGTPGKTIGILTIDIRDQYFASVIHSLEQELSLYQYNVILCNTGGEPDGQRNYISLLRQKQVDAMILVGSVFKNPHLKGIIREVTESVPLIIVNEKVSGPNIYSVICEEEKGIEEAVLKLHESGRRSFLFVKPGQTYSSNRKERGFIRAMESLGLPREKRVLEIPKGLPAAREASALIPALPFKADAVICGEDLTALGIIQGIKERGMKIPEDIAVTGFNNSIYSECSTPSITTVDSRSDAMGLAAARLTLDILNGRNVPVLSTINTSLIVRGSTGPL